MPRKIIRPIKGRPTSQTSPSMKTMPASIRMALLLLHALQGAFDHVLLEFLCLIQGIKLVFKILFTVFIDQLVIDAVADIRIHPTGLAASNKLAFGFAGTAAQQQACHAGKNQIFHNSFPSRVLVATGRIFVQVIRLS